MGFYVKSDDGAKLWIKQASKKDVILDQEMESNPWHPSAKAVVSDDGIHGFHEKSGGMFLRKGTAPVTVVYTRAGKLAGLRVDFKGPGIPKQTLGGKYVKPGAAFKKQKTKTAPANTGKEKKSKAGSKERKDKEKKAKEE